MKSTKLKIAGNTLVQLIGKFVTAGITFLITLVIARTYGVVGYGDFTKMTAYASLFYLLVDFGMNAVWLRQTTHNTQHETHNKKNIKNEEQTAKSEIRTENYPFASLFFTRFVWALVLIFIALAILPFLPSDEATQEGFTSAVIIGIIVLLPTILTQGLYSSYNALFQRALRYDRSVLAASVGSVTTLSLVFLLSRMTAPMPLLVTGYTIGGGVMAVAAYFLARRYRDDKSPFELALRRGKSLFIQSLPLGITLVVSLLHFRADIFMLTIYRTTVEVGVYGLASKVFELPLTIPIFFMNSLYPVLLNAKNKKDRSGQTDQESTPAAEKIKKRSLQILLTASILISVAGIVAAPLMTMIKEDFAASILPFRILMVSLPFFFVSALCMWILIAEDRRWTLVRIYTIGMMANIALNLVAIPRFGAAGAAVTTGVSEAIVVVLLLTQLPFARREAREPVSDKGDGEE